MSAPSDILMMHSVADVQGLNSITEQILGNGAHALAGMIARLPTRRRADGSDASAPSRPLGITMFGLTTPCVQAVTAELEADYDCLVFHATGIGGRSMESAGRFRPARRRPRPHHHRGRRPPRRRRLRRRPRTASAPSSATRSPMSARSARSTWSISGRSTRCRRSSAAAISSSTIRTSR